MNDSDPISEEEQALFRLAMRGVTPLVKKNKGLPSKIRDKTVQKSVMPTVHPVQRTPSNQPASRKSIQSKSVFKGNHSPIAPSTIIKKSTHRKYVTLQPGSRISDELNVLDLSYPEVKSEEVIYFFRPGFTYQEQRKLKRGHSHIKARLDLHQLGLEQALFQCEHFLQDCHAKRLRYVIIIHGKAQNTPTPILKNALNRWLRQHPLVLAFHSAKQSHGGTGALYVVIRS